MDGIVYFVEIEGSPPDGFEGGRGWDADPGPVFGGIEEGVTYNERLISATATPETLPWSNWGPWVGFSYSHPFILFDVGIQRTIKWRTRTQVRRWVLWQVWEKTFYDAEGNVLHRHYEHKNLGIHHWEYRIQMQHQTIWLMFRRVIWRGPIITGGISHWIRGEDFIPVP